MAATKATAADDEDDEWGPFTDFSSSPPSITTTKNNTQNDDDWGDFVESPLQSTATTNNNNNNNNNKVSEINGSSHSTTQQQQQQQQWVKAKGALPLSLFGIEEEEVQGQDQGQQQQPQSAVVVDVDGKNANGYLNNQSNFMNLAGDGGVGGINDILASLYSQNKNDENEAEIRYQNGLRFEFDGAKSINGDGLIVTDMDHKKKNNDEVENGLSSSNFGGWDLEGVTVNDEQVEEEEEEDDDGWEFKNAYSESKVDNGSDQGFVAFEFPGFSMQAESKVFPEVAKFESEFANGFQGQNDLVVMSNGSSNKSDGMTIDFDFNPGLVAPNSFTLDSYRQTSRKDSENGMNSHPLGEKVGSSETNGMFDLFAESNGTTSKSQDTDLQFSFMNGMVPQDAFGSGSILTKEKNGIKNVLDSHPLAESSDIDESFGVFEAAILDTASKQEDEPKVNGLPAKGGVRSQGNEMRLEKRNGPVPLSIFGEEGLETDTSLNIEDVFVSKQASYSENVHSRDPSFSITDLLSNLYSQADPIRVDSMHKPTENGLAFTNGVANSDFLVGEDFEDDSWEFKNADSQMTTNNDTSLHGGDPRFSTSATLDTYVDFYSKLKDKLSFVSQCHVDNLMKARGHAALSGAVDSLAAHDEEIQDACTELDREDIMSKEVNEEDHTTRDISLNELIEALRELKFQVLNSEFELSEKLQLAEKDLKSAIELIKHATLMMKILTLVSTEEQHSYVSTWFKMISVCTQELKHGAWIWKHSLEKNVNSRILSEPQGKRFILALGEMYRVVLVLKASVRLYKPWILLSSINLSSINALLEECEHLWSTSRLEEAIHSISDLSDSVYFGTVDALLTSIKHIQDTDAFALENHVFGQKESRCLLSGLTPELLPDMKMVVWNGEQYFLTLANLWANLISCDPPKLQRLKVG